MCQSASADTPESAVDEEEPLKPMEETKAYDEKKELREQNKFRAYMKEERRERAGAIGDTTNPLFEMDNEVVKTVHRMSCIEMTETEPEQLEEITKEYINEDGAGVKVTMNPAAAMRRQPKPPPPKPKPPPPDSFAYSIDALKLAPSCVRNWFENNPDLASLLMGAEGMDGANPLYVPKGKISEMPDDVKAWMLGALGNSHLMSDGSGGDGDFNNPLFVGKSKLGAAPDNVKAWLLEHDLGNHLMNMDGASGEFDNPLFVDKKLLASAPADVQNWFSQDLGEMNMMSFMADGGDFDNPLHVKRSQLADAPEEVMAWMERELGDLNLMSSGGGDGDFTNPLYVKKAMLADAPAAVREWFEGEFELSLMAFNPMAGDDGGETSNPLFLPTAQLQQAPAAMGDDGETMNPYYASDAQLRSAPSAVRRWFGVEDDMEEMNLLMGDSDDIAKPYYMSDQQLAEAPEEVKRWFGMDEEYNLLMRAEGGLGDTVNPFYAPGARLNRANTNLQQWFGVDQDFNLMMSAKGTKDGKEEEEEDISSSNPLFQQARMIERAPTFLRHAFHPAFQRQSSQFNMLMGGLDGDDDESSNPLFDSNMKVERADSRLFETFQDSDDYQMQHAQRVAKIKPKHRGLKRASVMTMNNKQVKKALLASHDMGAAEWTEEDEAKAKKSRRKHRGSMLQAAHSTYKMGVKAKALVMQKSKKNLAGIREEDEGEDEEQEGTGKVWVEDEEGRRYLTDVSNEEQQAMADKAAEFTEAAQKASLPSGAIGSLSGTPADGVKPKKGKRTSAIAKVAKRFSLLSAE
eukprot:gene1861-2530_t